VAHSAKKDFSKRERALYDFMMKLFGASLDIQKEENKFGGEFEKLCGKRFLSSESPEPWSMTTGLFRLTRKRPLSVGHHDARILHWREQLSRYLSSRHPGVKRVYAIELSPTERVESALCQSRLTRNWKERVKELEKIAGDLIDKTADMEEHELFDLSILCNISQALASTIGLDKLLAIVIG